MFCVSCGTQHDGNFCPSCGTPAPAGPSGQTSEKKHYKEVTLWEGKPAGIGDKMKGAVMLNPKIYKVTNQRIIILDGVLRKWQDEVELRRIKDISVRQSIPDRMFGVGDVFVASDDPNLGDFVLENVYKPFEVKETIRNAVMDVRANITLVHHERL